MPKCKYFYNYELTTKENEKFIFKERQDITDMFGISLSSIRHIMKGMHGERYKWAGYRIIKIHEKIRTL